MISMLEAAPSLTIRTTIFFSKDVNNMNMSILMKEDVFDQSDIFAKSWYLKMEGINTVKRLCVTSNGYSIV